MKIVITHPHLTSVVDNDQVPVELQKLSNVTSACCEYVNLADCMDYVIPQEREKLLRLAVDKLRHGGELNISGVELGEVGRQIFYGMLNIPQANSVLFSGKLSANSLAEEINLITECGLELVNAKIDGMYYTLKARRPDAQTEDLSDSM